MVLSLVIVIAFHVLARLMIRDIPSNIMMLSLVLLCAEVYMAATFIYAWNVSKRKQYANEKRVEYIPNTDELTGIYNRMRFEKLLDAQIDEAKDAGETFSLLLFDLDDFKNVINKFGHALGGTVLVTLVDIINSNIREADMFARWGGEEFMILFPGAGLEYAVEMAERLRKAVGTHHFEGVGNITISVGITVPEV